MKRATIIIKYWPALLIVFLPVICRAGIVLFASTENSITLPGVGEQMIMSGEDDTWKEKSTVYRKQKTADSSANSIGERDGLSALGAADFSMEKNDSTGRFSVDQEISDSSIKHYLLIAVLGGATGLVLIAAGAAQWWRHRSLRQNWLFPIVQEDGELTKLADSLPTPLIAKKQLESLQEEETEKPARRRAA